MKIDLRILVVAACFMGIAASVVVIVKNTGKSSYSPFVENITPMGRSTAGRVPSVLQMQVKATGVTFFLPDCDATEYKDKFFVHLYTNNTHSREDSVNLDFDLAQSMQKVTNPNGSISCIVHKSFSNFAVSEAGIGQYATPGGKCCEIIWSRFYVFDVSLPLK